VAKRGEHLSVDTKAKISVKVRETMLGHATSPETCARLSAANRGERNPNWGKHPSDETRAKMSKAHRGKCPSIETRAKLRSAGIGRHHSDATRAKLRAANLGKQLTAEVRAKIGAAHRGEHSPMWGKHLSTDTRAKLRMTKLGKRFSAELCAKLSAIHRALWENPEYRDRAIQAMRKGMVIRPTAPERQMRTLLDTHFPGEWKYVGNGDVIIGGKNPDFMNVNGRKAVIEVFGDYWHSKRVTGKEPEQEVADRIAHFARYGFDCLVIWERETCDESTMLKKAGAFCAS